MQIQEVLALKAQKRANIGKNDEHQVSSLTGRKLILYLKQHH